MKKAVTINDIAAMLGLSRNTVSKALNGQYVPESTRNLVLQTAKSLNYKQMNRDLENLNKKKRYKILLLSGKPLNNINYFIPIIRSIGNFCYDNEYDLLQYTFNSEISSFLIFSNYIKEYNCDGIIAIETFDYDFIIKLLNLKKPVVFIDFTTKEGFTSNKYDVINPDNYTPISYLIRKVVKRYDISRFTFIGDIKHCRSFSDRYNAMITALHTLGISHSKDEDIIRESNFDYGNINSLKSELLKLKKTPQCILCSNDFIARCVCNTLKSMNIAVPNSVFVIGFDDVVEAIIATPTLTTIGVNKKNIGLMSIKQLINRIENPDMAKLLINVESVPVERESTERKK